MDLGLVELRDSITTPLDSSDLPSGLDDNCAVGASGRDGVFFYVARLLTGRRDSAAGGFDCGLDASTAVNPVL
jgi:hypothetical protein